MLLKWMTAAIKGAAKMAPIAAGTLAVVAGLATSALAGNGPFGTPEIDPNSAASALTLLAGGVLLVKGRFRR